MSARSDVLLWAHRTISRKGQPPHVLLEINDNATPEQIQEAFHNIARTAHPDLHRNTLSADELELVTRAYSTVTNAYTVMRSITAQARVAAGPEPRAAAPPETRTAAGPEPRGSEPRVAVPPTVARAAAATPPAGARIVQAPQRSPAPAEPDVDPAQAMSPKALPYFRKAEACLKRGDLKGAVLQLKLAVNTDPTSAFLRTTLAEAEAVLRSTP